MRELSLLLVEMDTVTAERITEAADYGGVRVKLIGYQEQAHVYVIQLPVCPSERGSDGW